MAQGESNLACVIEEPIIRAKYSADNLMNHQFIIIIKLWIFYAQYSMELIYGKRLVA